MSGNNLAVKITADIVDLQTKFAVAKAEVSGLTAEMNKLARASAAGTIDSAGTARLQQLAGDLIAARSATQGYAGALEKAGVSLSTFGRSMESGHGSISTATREFRALFDELSSGRTRQTPGTLAIIAQRVLGLGPATLGAVAGIAALAGGLAYLAYRSIAAANALDQIQIGSAFVGNLDLSRAAIQRFSDELAKARGISASDAREIVGAFANMHDMSTVQIQALTAVVSDFAQSTGQKATEAAAALAKAFSEKESAAEYARSLGGISQSQINIAETADKSGDATAIFAAKFDLLNSALNRSRGAIDQHNSSIFSSIKTFLQYYGVVQTANGLEQGSTRLIQDNIAAREHQREVLAQVRAQLSQQAPNQDTTLKTGVQAAEKENPVSEQANEAAANIGKMNAALEIAKQRGDEVSIDKLNAGLAKAQEELSNLQFGPVLERMREQMEQVASTWDGTQSGMLAKQLQIAQATLAQTQAGSKERLSVLQEEARLEVQIRKSTSDEVVAAARTQISEIQANDSSGTISRLTAEQQVWREVLAGDQINAAQRLEVQRSLNSSIAALNKERASEGAAIARQDADTEVAIGRIRIDAEKQTLDAQVAATQAAVTKKYEALRNLTNQEFALDLQQLQNEASTLTQQPVEYNRVMDQIKELKAKNVQDLATLDRQAAEDFKRAAKQQESDWKGAIGEIENAEGGMVSDLLTKRKSLSQSLLSIGADLVTKEITNDLKAFTTKVALNDSTKALEQGGLAYHELVQLMKTTSTTTQVAAQNSAVIAGATAQTTAVTATRAAGQAAQGALGASTVMSDAAQAFAGTYASVSAIPVIGWAAAPGAASAAFAAVSSMVGPASLDIGTNYVPRDMLAQIHEGEAVVPKAYNPAAAGGAAGVGGGDVHNYGGNTINVGSSELKRMIAGRSEQRAVMNALAGAYRRGARPR